MLVSYGNPPRAGVLDDGRFHAIGGLVNEVRDVRVSAGRER